MERRKGEGVGVIMREEGGRSIEEIKLMRKIEDRLGHSKGDILTVNRTEHGTE